MQGRRAVTVDMHLMRNDAGRVRPVTADYIAGSPFQPELAGVPVQPEMHGDIGRHDPLPVIDDHQGAGKFARQDLAAKL